MQRIDAYSAPHSRYARQDAVLSPERRQLTSIAMLGGRTSPEGARLAKMMAASAGIRSIWSDFHGPIGQARHWIFADHATMVEAVNTNVAYEYLDGANPTDDLRQMLAESSYPTLLMFGNDPAWACDVLRALVQGAVGISVLLTAVGPSGLLVYRADAPETALADLQAAQREAPISSPCMELPMAAQAAALHEILTAPSEQPGSGIVAWYSLHDPLRISTPGDGSLAAFYRELARPIEQASFSGRSVVFVGAGGLGNWGPLPIVLDGPVAASVYDMDSFADSNLSRQPLGVAHVGQPKALAVAQQLQQISPRSEICGFLRQICGPDDFGSLDPQTIVVSLPDNDTARCISLDAALGAGCLGGTAAVSATHARVIVQQHACRECLGLRADDLASGSESCAAVGEASIVTMNALAAAILVSEMRQTLAGRSSRNLRYYGDAEHSVANRFARHLTAPPCDHLPARWPHSANTRHTIGEDHASPPVL